MIGNTHAEDLTTARRAQRVVRPRASGERSRERSQLSPREAQLIALVARGFSNKEIATETGLTPDTVKIYLSRAYGVLGFTSRYEVISWVLGGTVRHQREPHERP